MRWCPSALPAVLASALLLLPMAPAAASQPGSAAAYADQGSPASLADAVAGAMEQAGQLIRAEALIGESDAVRRQAGAWIADDPALRLKGVSDQLTGDDGAYEFEALVELPLWLPGQRRARLELASSLGMRADALSRLLHWEVAGAVRDAVWEAELAEVRLRQTAAAYEAARALEAVVAKRFEAGELARLDLLTAAQETLALQAELTAALAAQEQAMAAYAQLTGRQTLPQPPNWPPNLSLDLSLNRPADLPAAADAATGGEGMAGATSLDAAIGGERIALPDDHPLLADAGAALSGARAERTRVASDRRGNPVLSLGGRRTRDARSAPTDDALQLEVVIPFGLPSQSAPQIAASERQVTERLAELHRLRREAERELVAALLGRRGAAAALLVAERRARLAEDGLAVAERAFELGETNLGERLRAERRAREAKLDLALRRAEQGQALARVNQALGIIPQ